MDFDGTTSVSQVRGIEAKDALILWMDSLKAEGACGLTADQRLRIIRAFHEDLANVQPLDGIVSVWCATISVPDVGLVLLNIIPTVEMFGVLIREN
jgi:hypothetical protein